MAMTRKHYRELVRILRAVAMPDHSRTMMAEALAAMCQRDNPRFDKKLFMHEVMKDGVS